MDLCINYVNKTLDLWPWLVMNQCLKDGCGGHMAQVVMLPRLSMIAGPAPLILGYIEKIYIRI